MAKKYSVATLKIGNAGEAPSQQVITWNTGTLEELVEQFKPVLERGQNVANAEHYGRTRLPVDMTPKTYDALIVALNNAYRNRTDNQARYQNKYR